MLFLSHVCEKNNMRPPALSIVERGQAACLLRHRQTADKPSNGGSWNTPCCVEHLAHSCPRSFVVSTT